MSRDESEPPSLRDQTQAFLHEFFVKGQELIRELIEENERLRTSVPSDEPATELSPTSAEMVGRLMKQVEALESEAAEIRRMAGVVQNDVGFRNRLQSLEGEHYHLAAMYVASGHFHAASTVDEVLRTVTEILLNFVGVGAFTLFVVDEPRQVLFPLWREGGDPNEHSELPRPTEGPMADVLSIGRAWRAGDPMGATDDALMHLPLYSGTRLMGVICVRASCPKRANSSTLTLVCSSSSPVTPVSALRPRGYARMPRRRPWSGRPSSIWWVMTRPSEQASNPGGA